MQLVTFSFQTGTTTFHFNMIIFLDNSNLLNVKEGLIAHGCNAQGVMGSGVAKQLRAKYPSVYESYSRHISEFREMGVRLIGSVDYVRVADKVVVANMITQEYYGKDGSQYVDYSAMIESMSYTLARSDELCLDVHIPYMIGAGLGGGDLATIKTIYEDLSKLHGKNIYCHILNK